jgi:hypothetical protein
MKTMMKTQPPSIFNLPRLLVIIFTAWLLLVAHQSRAGQGCQELPPSGEAFENGLNLGVKVKDTLEASGAEIALIARVGQDLRKYGLKHSHMAFVVRDHSQGRWTVVHMLNLCGKADSALFKEGLGAFFMDTPFRYEALIAIPNAATQARLKIILASDMPTAFKSARYNMLAYPYNIASQNSNGWVLELLNAGMTDVTIDTRFKAVAYAKVKGFEPTTIHLNTLERLGAGITRQNISFDDHPFARRMAGKIDTVTVASVIQYLQRNDGEVVLREVAL